MWDGRLTRRPVGRLLVAVLVALLSLVAVHGAGSAATPAGALATPHASIGAAPHQPGLGAIGRGEQDAGPRRSAVSAHSEQELPPPAPRLVAVTVAPVVAPPAPAVAAAPVTTDRAGPHGRTVSGRSSRAPPA
ncbi:hypothetical protein ACI2K4_08240 [Micromonospora sp. NPDC050397]|uniref:hypothetical protein n=1 Tax=Micromonospora sp. NPDC050397 TaxID=3364279 RepID=UPI00384FC76C